MLRVLVDKRVAMRSVSDFPYPDGRYSHLQRGKKERKKERERCRDQSVIIRPIARNAMGLVLWGVREKGEEWRRKERRREETKAKQREGEEKTTQQ